MSNGLFAGLLTNFDVVAEGVLLLLLSIQLMTGAVLAGWQLSHGKIRQATRAWLAIEQGNPFEDLITMLAIPTLGLIVILCCT